MNEILAFSTRMHRFTMQFINTTSPFMVFLGYLCSIMGLILNKPQAVLLGSALWIPLVGIQIINVSVSSITDAIITKDLHDKKTN